MNAERMADAIEWMVVGAIIMLWVCEVISVVLSVVSVVFGLGDTLSLP
jgi:hypothetical protein